MEDAQNNNQLEQGVVGEMQAETALIQPVATNTDLQQESAVSGYEEAIAVKQLSEATAEPQLSADAFDLEEQVALIEALLFANGDPLSIDRLSEITRLSDDQIKAAISTLKVRLEKLVGGTELVEIAGSLQIRTKVVFAPFIRELKSGKPRRLSAAALETLAVVAYRQPVVRSDIEKIRGVDVSPTLKTLLEKRFIRIVGHQESVGQPALYGTTDDFLKVFGLSSLAQLPTLRDLKEIEAEPGEPETNERDSSINESKLEIQQQPQTSQQTSQQAAQQ